ncbi:MAG TPA: GNAT family N-acetyltransferase, partial [Stellaceae bacterium]|nr:GNAT family N-acetyltransferase [Stellaceae bacterium]
MDAIKKILHPEALHSSRLEGRRTRMQSADVTLRPARRDDVAAIAALLADDALGARREDPGALNVYLAAFDEIAAQPGNQLVVAERAGEPASEKIVGCLQLTVIPGLARRGVKRGQIEGVRVAASCRGLGIGERLIRHAIELLRAAGCGLVQLT